MHEKHRCIGTRTVASPPSTWTLPNGESFKASVTSTTREIYENDCKHCGQSYRIDGIYGTIRELRFEDTCQNCEYLEPDPNMED